MEHGWKWTMNEEGIYVYIWYVLFIYVLYICIIYIYMYIYMYMYIYIYMYMYMYMPYDSKDYYGNGSSMKDYFIFCENSALSFTVIHALEFYMCTHVHIHHANSCKRIIHMFFPKRSMSWPLVMSIFRVCAVFSLDSCDQLDEWGVPKHQVETHQYMKHRTLWYDISCIDRSDCSKKFQTGPLNRPPPNP